MDQYPKADMGSLCSIITDKALAIDFNKVKVVVNEAGRALYFSRSVIPHNRDQEEQTLHYKHIGVYAFRKEALMEFSKQEMTPLEAAEKVECIRYLEHGKKIKMVATDVLNFGIDTPEDLQQAKAFLNEIKSK